MDGERAGDRGGSWIRQVGRGSCWVERDEGHLAARRNEETETYVTHIMMTFLD